MILNTGLSLVIVQRIKNVDVCSTCWERPQMALVRCTAQKSKMQNAKNKDVDGICSELPQMASKSCKDCHIRTTERSSRHNYWKKLQTTKKWLCFEIRIDFRARILISGTIATTMEGWPPKRWKWSLCVITRLPLNVAAFFLLSKWKSMKSMQLRAKNFLLRAPAGGWEQW